MGKFYHKKQWPKVLIIEGFWGVGKTKIIRQISSKYDFFIIDEPVHLQKNITGDISKWYHEQHVRRHLLAYNKILEDEKVIMERSLISNMAFFYAKTGELPPFYERDIQKFQILQDCAIVLMYADFIFVQKQALALKDETVKSRFLSRDFYKKYLSFYKKILPTLLNKRIILIKVNRNNEFIKGSSIIKQLEEKFTSLNDAVRKDHWWQDTKEVITLVKKYLVPLKKRQG